LEHETKYKKKALEDGRREMKERRNQERKIKIKKEIKEERKIAHTKTKEREGI
jgi:hypothetical protein